MVGRAHVATDEQIVKELEDPDIESQQVLYRDVHPKVEDHPSCTSMRCLPKVVPQECNFTEAEHRPWELLRSSAVVSSSPRKPAPAVVVLGGGGSFASQAPYLLDDGRGGRYLVKHSIGSRLYYLVEVPGP